MYVIMIYIYIYILRSNQLTVAIFRVATEVNYLCQANAVNGEDNVFTLCVCVSVCARSHGRNF